MKNSISSSHELVGKSPDRSPKKLGFSKVVAGGRIVLLDKTKPFLERMVTGSLHGGIRETKSKSEAVIESVTANLEAGIRLVNSQEVSLAKIGGKLSVLALNLNKVRNQSSVHTQRVAAQDDYNSAKEAIKIEALKTFDNTALFSEGPTKPLTIAVPNRNEWEGITVDRIDLKQPGIQSVLKGKAYGDGPGLFIEHQSIQRAFNEWRGLCNLNRLNWGLLMDRLHGVNNLAEKIKKGGVWHVPDFPDDPMLGPLRRPNRNN